MSRRNHSLTSLFAATLFTSAALLFWVEPMVAKMLLPFLGGTPAVWNTCLLFFQAALLAGYAYVLVVTRRLRTTRAQALVHGALVVYFALNRRKLRKLEAEVAADAETGAD